MLQTLLCHIRGEIPKGRTTALILPMLPCLENLVIQDCYSYNQAGNVYAATEELMASAARSGHATGTMLLSNLSHVELIRDAVTHQSSELIHLFAGLPSMRYLRIKK